jgi:curved DNA-binding protein CbpA
MDFTKDYYAILRILPTAELVVIKAAYKAMLKVYHPDKFNGSKSEAHVKTVEINEAHSILSVASKRQEYDNSRGNTDDKAYSYKEESKSESDFSSEFYTLEKDWQVAIKYQPELVGIVGALSKISSKLAFTYKAVIIESQEFSEKEKIADKMEQEYFSLYFGVNKQIQSFAKTLIIGNHRDAARELNKAVTVLGKGVEVDRIIEQIKNEFDLHPREYTKTNDENYYKDKDKNDNEVQRFFSIFGGLIIFVIIYALTL